MSIRDLKDLDGMKRVSTAVAVTLREMCAYARSGITTQQLDEFGGRMLRRFGARSAPRLTYGFPGHTCISLNHEIAHGVPARGRTIQEGDLLNIDVSAELGGYWSDNGCSLVVGEDIHNHQPLVDTSKHILREAINRIRDQVWMRDLGGYIEQQAGKKGYLVIRNLGGHGIGKSLHELPEAIVNYRARYDRRRFVKHSVIALETFISTRSTHAVTMSDGFTLVGNRGGFTVQHEHTLVITDKTPVVLTEENGV